MTSAERVRFTAWLSATEHNGVTERAEQFGVSLNYIIRIAVREYLGLPTVVVQPKEKNV